MATKRIIGKPVPSKAAEIGRVTVKDGGYIALYHWSVKTGAGDRWCIVTSFADAVYRQMRTSQVSVNKYLAEMMPDLRAAQAAGRVSKITGCFDRGVA